MNKQYYVLWNENIDGPDVNNMPETHGPFPSLKKAKAFILEDAENTVDISTLEHFGKDEEWGSRYAILQLLDVLVPVPTVSVKFGLMRRVNEE